MAPVWQAIRGSQSPLWMARRLGTQTDPLPADYIHYGDILFKTGSASEYHRALARSALKGHVPYEAIFFDLLRAGNIGSRGVRSERKTSYRPPH